MEQDPEVADHMLERLDAHGAATRCARMVYRSWAKGRSPTIIAASHALEKPATP
jgi:hypothetical protein